MSNLTSISRLIEKIILQQLNTHFQGNNLLPKYQSAYQKHHFTETAILNICDNILKKNMENGMTTVMTCLDLSAAFDTVNHHILKLIMENNFGIERTALKWFTSYLENRQFVVQISNSISAIKIINHSVPQGSILGPVLFNCYVSTLPGSITTDNIQSYLGMQMTIP